MVDGEPTWARRLRSSPAGSRSAQSTVPESERRGSAERTFAGVAGDPFDALGDPNRRTIVELLGQGSRSVQELADELPISRPAVSRHLRLLKDAGLVEEQPLGSAAHLPAAGGRRRGRARLPVAGVG